MASRELAEVLESVDAVDLPDEESEVGLVLAGDDETEDDLEDPTITDEQPAQHPMLQVIEALKVSWEERIANLHPWEVNEIARRMNLFARRVLESACDEVRVTDEKIDRLSGLNRDEAICGKIVAWEWFLAPYRGRKPRLALEEVCGVLDLDPEHVRSCVRQYATKTKFRMPPGYRIRLFSLDPEFNEDQIRKRRPHDEDDAVVEALSCGPAESPDPPALPSPLPSPLLDAIFSGVEAPADTVVDLPSRDARSVTTTLPAADLAMLEALGEGALDLLSDL